MNEATQLESPAGSPRGCVQHIVRPLSVLDFIAIIRSSRPDSEHFFMNGGCWEMFCLLRRLWPDAQPYHSWTDDVTLGVGQHVATKIGDYLYDIRGRVRRPSLYSAMTRSSWPSLHTGDRPHRWVKRYRGWANTQLSDAQRSD